MNTKNPIESLTHLALVLPILRTPFTILQMKKIYTCLAVALLVFSASHSFGQSENVREIEQIRNHLLSEGDLSAKDLTELIPTDRYNSAQNRVTHSYMAQAHEGVKIFNTSLSAAFDADGQLVSAASRFLPISKYVAESVQPAISAEAAAQNLTDLSAFPGLTVREHTRGDQSKLIFTLDGFTHESRVELGFFAKEGHLLLSWMFDIEFPDGTQWNQYVVSAHTGEVIRKYDLVVSCVPFATGTRHTHKNLLHPSPSSVLTPFDGSGYRAFPFPVESPLHGERAFLEEPADPAASPYGWHDEDGQEGVEYTITRGNNVYAYEDVNDWNIPGFSPDGGPELNFDFAYDPTDAAENYRSASIVNLFYATNRIHDILYHYGFDEAAGNFQQLNYSGEGFGSDALRAEAQDGGGTNNANMATPADGSAPRMQMYLWLTTNMNNEGLVIHEPALIAGAYAISSPAAFGPGLPAEGLTAELGLAPDASTDVLDLCSPPIDGSLLDGRIAVVRRGSCTFVEKVQMAQNHGAVAVIVVNNVPGDVINMGGDPGSIFIPSVMVTQGVGENVIAAIQGVESMTATLSPPGGETVKDASFDNGVIIHEYGHGLSNRLTGGPSQAACLQNDEQPGEGWSDWYAIMMTMDLEAENPAYRPMATFSAGQAEDGNGIRPVAYDTSFSVNGYTYADLPSSTLTIPHGIGFVWSTMLWDLTWAFIDEYGYDPDIIHGSGGNNMVMQLVTDGMKLQPCSPGFVDARDAILMADELRNGGLNKCLIWRAFAKRGLGFSADQGSSESVMDGTAAFDLPAQCLDATMPPIADFQADEVETCTGLVHFQDLSIQTPQSWLWDFGDGNTSVLQNPWHQYDAPGVYTVTLTVTNTLGEDDITRTDYIAYALPGTPTADDVQGCAGEEIVLSATATGGGEIRWKNAAMEVLAIGSDISVVVGEGTTSYFAEEIIGVVDTAHVGPENSSIGSGGYHQNAFVGTVDFTVEKPLTIASAWVNSAMMGTRNVHLWNAAGGVGTVVQTIPVEIDFVGPGRVDLGFVIDQPGTYSLGLSMAALYRNDGGVQYPYVYPDLMTITGSSAGLDHYYFFYDLEVIPQVCVGGTAEVQVQSVPGAAFDYTVTDLSASFSPSDEGAVTESWDFGDGHTSTEQTPTHVYESPGFYTVVHTTANGCVAEIEIAVGIVGTSEADRSGYTVYPNPTRDRLNIVFPAHLVGRTAVLELHSPSGGVVLREEVTVGANGILHLAPLSSGVFILSVTTGESRTMQRVVVLD